MNATKNLQAQLMPMTVADGLTVNILPNEQFEFLMTTKEVAHGYGTSDYVVRKTMLRHSDEFIEGKHYVLGKDLYQKGGTKCPTLENAVTKCHTLFNAQPNQVLMTYYHSDVIQISIGDRELFSYTERLEFAKNDGFDCWEDFFNYFYPKIKAAPKEIYTPKLIHWTDLRY